MLAMANPFVRYLVFGALLGSVLFSWFSPQFITWYFAPPVELAITCRAAVQWGLDVYRKMLLVGAGIGSVLGIFVFVFVKKRQSAIKKA